MGVHNRISETKYQQIKKMLKTPADDPKAMKTFGICAATARNIRNTADYQKYCERVFRYHGDPNRAKTKFVEPISRKEIDDYWRQFEVLDGGDDRGTGMLGLVLLFLCVVASSALTVGLIWFAINFLGGME